MPTKQPSDLPRDNQSQTTSRTVLFISDGTGITAETMGKGLLSQFEAINFRHIRLPFIDNLEKAMNCVHRIQRIREHDGIRPLVIMSIINPDISAVLRQEDALFLDLFETFITPLENELGIQSTHAIGLTHGQSSQYADRIAAINYALAHDDGIANTGLKNANVILVGVSRCGKTPTCMYMSMQFNVKAANFPLVPDDFERHYLPDSLLPYRDKLFGLTIAPEQLHRIREQRRPDSHYASLDNCRYEIDAAEKMMQREGIKWLDMTSRSIEEISVEIIQKMNIKPS